MPKFYDLGFEEFISENVKELTSTKAWMKSKTFKLCTGIDDLKKFVDEAIEYGKCVLDVETTGLNTRPGKYMDKLVGIGLAYNTTYGYYIPINHKVDLPLNIPLDKVLVEIARLCANCVIIVHNAKFDLNVLKNHGIIIDQFDRFEDTLILARLYDAGQKEIGLKVLSESLLNQPMIELSEIAGKEKRLDMISPATAVHYVSSDAVCTMGLFEFFLKEPTIIDQKAIYNLEKRLVFVVLQMESNLVWIDKEYLIQERERIEKRLKDIAEELYRIAGRKFDLNSPKQLGNILFDELKYPYPAKEKTASGQYMTDTATLEKISETYPMMKKLIEYRQLEKCQGTYVENLIKNCDEDSCVKLSFNQNGTDTGRFSSPGGKGLEADGYSGVNVQSIPSNYSEDIPDIRKAFRARPGKKIVAMDFSGEELRVAANLSGETKWIDEFLYGSADLHTATAKAIFKREEITKAERQLSKTVNFLSLYGGGPRGLAEQARISEQEAKRTLTNFFSGLPKLSRWIDVERARARKIKYARTALGRIRPLHMFYNTEDKGQMAHADRCATNFLVQGVCADIMKICMVRVWEWVKKEHLEDEVKLLITMHDEIVYEIPEDKVAAYVPELNNIMCLGDILQEILHWPVPLVIDAEYGDTWHVDHDLFKERPELKNAKPVLFRNATQITESAPQSSPEEPAVPKTEEPPPAAQAIASPAPGTPTDVTEVVMESLVVPVSETPPESPVSKPDTAPAVNESPDVLIYQLRDLGPRTLQTLNFLLPILCEEAKQETRYCGPKKLLRLVDKEGNMLLVSDFAVRVDSFLFATFMFGI